MQGIIIPIGVNLSPLQQGLDKIKGMFGNLGKSLSSFQMPPWMGALTSGLSVAGLKGVLDEFDRIGDLSKRLGVSAESLQRLGGVAKISGSDMEGMAKALTEMTRKLGDTGSGGDAAREALGKLGISAQQFVALPLEEQLATLADAFVASGGDAEAFSSVLDLLGTRAGANLIPALREGGDAIREMGATIATVSDDSVEKIQAINDKWDKLVLSMKAGIGETAAGTSDFLGAMGRGLEATAKKIGEKGFARNLWDIVTPCDNPVAEWWKETGNALLAQQAEELRVEPPPAVPKKPEPDYAAFEAKAAAVVNGMGDQLQDAIDGVMTNIRAGAQGFTATGGAVQERMVQETSWLREAMDNLVTSLGRVGGDNPGALPMMDATVTAIRNAADSLGIKLDRIIANTAPRPDGAMAATWA